MDDTASESSSPNEGNRTVKARNSEDRDPDELPEDLDDVLNDDNDEEVRAGLLSDSTPLRRAASEESKSIWYLILLTLALGGLQIVWSLEMSGISPYLLALGLSKSLLALVWIAGPLSGTVVQPYVGILSDNCRSRWGRRRPFIVAGGAATVICLLLLSWAREIVGSIFRILDGSRDSKASHITTQIFAVLIVYVLNFAINVIEAAIRALIVDCAPTHQQEDANAWASRITNLANIIGFIAGYLDLPIIFPFLGYTQFQVLSAIASLSLSSTAAISCLYVQEQDARSFGPPSNAGSLGLIAFFRYLFSAAKNLAPQIKKVCFVQVWAWIGWFPFLFYSTIFVGNAYAQPYFEADPNLPKEEVDAIWERGTRAGAFSLFVYAVTSFAASIILPFIIVPAYQATDDKKSTSTTYRLRGFRGLSLASLQIPHFTLRRAWLFSHILFTVLMWSTFFVRSTVGATALVGAVGIPWALTSWAPFALIAAEISNRDAIRRGLRAPQPRRTDASAQEQESLHDPQASAADQAGVVLGIHNVSIAAPQAIASFVCSATFRALQKPRGKPGDGSVGWVLRLGGLCAIGAAWFTRWVEEGDEVDQREIPNESASTLEP